MSASFDQSTRKTPDFFPNALAAKQPNLNSVKYKVWSVMQEKVYKERTNVVDKLLLPILTA